MDETIRKIKMFAVGSDEFVSFLGEFNSIEDIKIRPSDFSNDVILEFEEYWIGDEE